MQAVPYQWQPHLVGCLLPVVHADVFSSISHPCFLCLHTRGTYTPPHGSILGASTVTSSFCYSDTTSSLPCLVALICPKPDPKILLLNIELELKSEKENAEIRLDDPAQYQSIVDAGAAQTAAAAAILQSTANTQQPAGQAFISYIYFDISYIYVDFPCVL